MKIFSKWKIKENALIVIKKYPVVLASFLVLGILLILNNHLTLEDDEIIIKLILSTIIFIGNALICKAIVMQYEKINTIKYIVGLCISVGLSVLFYFTLKLGEDWSMIRTMIFIFIQALAFISLPFIKDDNRVEHFANSIVIRLLITGILYLIACGGICGVLFALESLFDINIMNELYTDVFIVLGTTFLPMVWLYGINFKVEPSEKKLYKILLVYVCIPLLFVYSLVVYGYIIKIALNNFIMPSSIISNLVLWYSLVSVAVIYLARPYTKSPLAKFFYKWYPLISILPIITMFVSISMRINQYGITINRYFLVAGGIWLSLMFAYLIYKRFAKKERLNNVIIISLAIIALICVIEPISANTVATKAQKVQLENVVSKYIADGELAINDMEIEEIEQAQDIIYYLDNNNYRYSDNLSIFAKNIDFLTEEQIKMILDVNTYNYELTEDGWYSMRYYPETYGEFEILSIEGYSYFFTLNYYNFMEQQEIEIDNYRIETISGETEEKRDLTDTVFKVYVDDVLRNEVDIVKCYKDKILEKELSFGNEKSDYYYEDENKEYKIIIKNINYEYNDEGEVRLEYVEAMILIK